MDNTIQVYVTNLSRFEYDGLIIACLLYTSDAADE